MKKKPKNKKSGQRPQPGHEELVGHLAQAHQFKKRFEKLYETVRKIQDRLDDAEIHINLLTRLLTTLCIEKLGMRIGVLKRLLKRIEKEAIRDSQIMHLESIYRLPHHSHKKPPLSNKPAKKDPWDEIS